MPVTAEQIREFAYNNLEGQPLYDASLIDQVRVLTRSEHVQGVVNGIVKSAYTSVSNQFLARLVKDDLSGKPTGPFVTARLRALRSSMKSLIDGWAQTTGDKLGKFLIDELGNVAIKSSDAARLALGYALRAETAPEPAPDAAASMRAYEAALDAGSVDTGTTTAALRWSVASPQPHILLSLASALPIKGHIMTEWIDQWTSMAKFNVSAALMQGFAAGETPAQIVKRIRDVGEFSAAAARTLVRTSFSAVSATAREMLFGENRDIIKSVIWVSKLDSHTTPICRELDDKVFKIGEGPRPPAHYNCRSTIAPVMKMFDEIFGDSLKAPNTPPPKVVPKAAPTKRTFKTISDRSYSNFIEMAPKIGTTSVAPFESDALTDYRAAGYVHMHNMVDAARTGALSKILASGKPLSQFQRNNQTRIAREIAEIDDMMNKNRIKGDCMLYRGISTMELNLPKGVSYISDLNGHEFTGSGFNSTSTKQIIAESFAREVRVTGEEKLPGRTVLSIRTPKGVRAIGMDKSTEYEVLLDRGLRFRVTGAKVNDHWSGKILELTVDIVGYDDRRNNFATMLAENKLYTPNVDGPAFSDVDRNKDVVEAFAAASANGLKKT